MGGGMGDGMGDGWVWAGNASERVDEDSSHGANRGRRSWAVAGGSTGKAAASTGNKRE
jgi:hypothetical protein